MYSYCNILLIVTPIILFFAPLSSAFVLMLYAIKIPYKDHFREMKYLVYPIIIFLLYAAFRCKSMLSFIHLLQLLFIITIAIYSLMFAKSKHRVASDIYVCAYCIVLIILCFEYLSNGLLLVNLNTYILHKNVIYSHDYINRSIFFLSLGIWPIIYYNRRYTISITVLSILLIMIYSSESAKLAIIAGMITFYISKKYINHFDYVLKTLFIVINSFTPFLINTIIHLESIQNIKEIIPNSFKHRLYIWQNVLDLIYKKPFMGWGFDASRILSDYNNSYISLFGDNMSLLPSHPHNMVLQILLELGIIGLISYTLIWISIINFVSKLNLGIQFKSSMYGLLLTYFVFLQTSYNIWASWLVAIIFIICNVFIVINKDIN